MKQILLICAVVMGQSVLAADKKPLIADPIVEKAIRKRIYKPKGELTKADLDKVRRLSLFNTKITDEGLKEVAKLKQLTYLNLADTQITDAGLNEVAKLQQLILLWLSDTKVTDAGVAASKKALPKCTIIGP